MKILANLVSLGLLTTLVSCGEDVGGSNRPLTQNPEVNIPNIEGTTVIQRSMIHRRKGSPSITTQQEISKTLDGSLAPGLYFTIPVMEIDDEGSSRNVTTLSSIGRPNVACGVGDFAGVNARIEDCATKNKTKATWQGNQYGASGEGTWNLVLKDTDKEFWLDRSTGLVWSHLVSTSATVNAFNWCKASGNMQGATSTEIIDCAKDGENQNLCESLNLSEVGGQILWRLPTRNDYLQADLNGLRFVLTRETDQGLWTATMRSSTVGRAEAWVYSSKEGTLIAGNLTTNRQVRCIGVPKL